jgi:hypothetical protein
MRVSGVSERAFGKRCASTRAAPGSTSFLVAGALLGVLLAGCGGSEAARKKPPPDQRYGHRYDTAGDTGRTTLTLAPPREGVEYSYYDVPVSDVIVRTAPFEEGREAVPAEVLIKGALPNSCLTLASAEQERDAHLLTVRLRMRWPTGPNTRCERFGRPFRFYLPLEGRYAPGDYTLKLNGTVYPFTVRRSG